MICETFSYIFQKKWSKVSLGFWRKYPHPSRPDIISIDIIDKHIEGDILSVTRLVTGEVMIPSWLKSNFVTSPLCYVIETIVVDKNTQKLDIHTRNITFSGMVDVVEFCSYYSTGQNTHLDQKVKINSKLMLIGYQVEKWIFDNFTEKIYNGRLIINDLIDSGSNENGE